MSVRTTVLGSYPRPVELIQAIRRHSKKQISDQELEEAYKSATRKVMHEQIDSGVDFITDGLLRWDDLITYLAKDMDGFEIKGLIRFFDNNFYYRKPYAEGKISQRTNSLKEDFLFAKSIYGRIKTVLFGPYSFAKHSVNEAYENERDFVLDIASALNKTARELESAGADFIQIDEPSLTAEEEPDFELAREALSATVSGLKAKTFMHTYFGSARDRAAEFLDFPVDGLGFDLVSKDDLSVLEGLDFNKELSLGLIDARNTRLESIDKLKEQIERAEKIADKEKIWLCPNYGLDLLPREIILKKLKIMSEAAKNV